MMKALGTAIMMIGLAACGAAQTTSGSGSGGGSGYVECDGVQCGVPASCVAVVGMTPEQTKHECVLKCKDDTICAAQTPKGQTCQSVHDIGMICQLGGD